MSNISIIFSFYNEEETLPVLIDQIRSILAKEPEDYELIFVNDASTDDSVVVIRRCIKSLSKERLILVNMSRRFGVEECFLAGCQVAKGDAVIFMYADLQEPPEILHDMLEKWRAGADIVHTIRRRRINGNPFKTLATKCAYWWIGALSDIDIPRNAGDCKLMSRRVANHLLQLTETEPYLRGLIPWFGFKQESIIYDLMPRKAGKSKVAAFGNKSLKVFFSGTISFSSFPIHVIIFAAVFGIILTAILTMIFIFHYHGINPLGWMAVFLLFLWSTIMLAMGIIGLYILRIYHNTLGRPRYIIQDVIELKS